MAVKKERAEEEKTVLKNSAPKPKTKPVKPAKLIPEKERSEAEKAVLKKPARTRKPKPTVEELKPVKRDLEKELREYRFDKKMVESVAEEMKQWIHFCFMSLEERMTIAAIVIKASQEYESNKIHSTSIVDQSDAILAMARRLGC